MAFQLGNLGLITEEVAEVFPELAAYGPDGQPETVRYQFLPPTAAERGAAAAGPATGMNPQCPPS